MNQTLGNDLASAAKLADWLIKNGLKKPHIAYIIASRKFNIAWPEMVKKEYYKNWKTKQMKLI